MHHPYTQAFAEHCARDAGDPNLLDILSGTVERSNTLMQLMRVEYAPVPNYNDI